MRMYRTDQTMENTTGGSDYPLNELKIAGVDLTKPDTVKNALKVFSDTVDELEKLL